MERKQNQIRPEFCSWRNREREINREPERTGLTCILSQQVPSLRADFPACEKRRHSRGLVWRAESLPGHCRNSPPRFGVFSAPVSARPFLISVLRCCRLVRQSQRPVRRPPVGGNDGPGGGT